MSAMSPEQRTMIVAKLVADGDASTCFKAACQQGMPPGDIRALYRRVRSIGSQAWIERFRERFPADVLGESARFRIRERLANHGDDMDLRALELADRISLRDEVPDDYVEDLDQAIRTRLSRMRSGGADKKKAAS